MGESLTEYLRMKIHPDISNNEWPHIIVRGSHLRSAPARISTIEKSGKLFNWQRPTTTTGKHGGLELHCFPGRNYVHHYASIVATYLALKGRDPSIIKSLEPSPDECMAPLLNSNLAKLGSIDMAVLGYVHGLPGLTGSEPWEDGAAVDQLFAWRTRKLRNGMKVAFVGCRVSFWGDIAGNLVRALQQLCQVKSVLYVGKLGSLNPEHVPNRVLATGNTTSIGATRLEWHNPLAHMIDSSVRIVQGHHCTLPSVLDETHEWFSNHRKSSDWVDPEIGHMALAAAAAGMEFGYLHIVSDNLAKKYLHDLSNERLKQVLDDRSAICADIEDAIETFLQQRSGVSI